MAMTTKFKWTEDKVFQFVNWYVQLHRLPFNYTLENGEIVESFKRGDNPKLWWEFPEHTELKTIDEIEGEILINDVIMNSKLLSPDQIEFLIAMLQIKLEKLNKKEM